MVGASASDTHCSRKSSAKRTVCANARQCLRACSPVRAATMKTNMLFRRAASHADGCMLLVWRSTALHSEAAPNSCMISW